MVVKIGLLQVACNVHAFLNLQSKLFMAGFKFYEAAGPSRVVKGQRGNWEA